MLRSTHINVALIQATWYTPTGVADVHAVVESLTLVVVLQVFTYDVGLWVTKH